MNIKNTQKHDAAGAATSTATGLKTQSMRISAISIGVNLALSLVKLAAGYWGNSQALVADAVHSASDVLTTVIVMVSLLIAAKAPDDTHQYGHQKYESVASLFLGLLLAYVGIKIGITGGRSLWDGSYHTAPIPSVLAAVAAIVSIVVKEVMFRVTIVIARRENSTALKADAWHHRSDALSSIGSLVGVVFARFGVPAMDPIASLVICVFILKTAAEIVISAVKLLTDSACDPETDTAMRTLVASVPGVLQIDLLKTRAFGSGLYADVEIRVDGSLPLTDAHHIAETVHDAIEAQFPTVLHCMVHVNPDEAV